jgi:hypothetical protein
MEDSRGRDTRSIIQSAILVAAPILFCFWLFRLGLKAWFQQDDFAHLNLSATVHSFRDLIRVTFFPVAHLTVRPLSERLFFAAGYAFFGLDALPYRIVVFMTQAVDIALVVAVTARLTGSQIAGAIAAILWLANTALMTPLTWTCAYNQVLWACLVLAAFYSMLRGRTVAQWVFYLLGFLTLELNVVYPALVTSYALAKDRSRIKESLLLWIPALLYAGGNLVLVPKTNAGVYSLHFDAAIFRTLATYWTWALGSVPSALQAGVPQWLEGIIVTAATVALLGFAILRLRRGDWLPAFFVAWFVITLGPLLPLREHLSDYYLFVPTIGLAMGAAYGLARPAPLTLRIPVAALAAVYVVCGIVAVRWYQNDFVQKSWAMRRVMLGVETINELHPGKTILLANVDENLFWSGIFDHPFGLVGKDPVYLSPETARKIRSYPGLVNIGDYTVPEEAAAEGLGRGDVVVYSVGAEKLQNITPMYRQIVDRQISGRAPAKVDVGNPMLSYLLDANWYDIEGNFRWMPKSAGLQVAGPETAGQKLHVIGFCLSIQAAAGPLTITAEMEGIRSSPEPVPNCTDIVDLAFAIPPEMVGRKRMNVRIEVNRAGRYGPDTRDLGFAVRTVEIR